MLPKKVRIIEIMPLQAKVGGKPTSYKIGDVFEVDRPGVTPNGLVATDGTVLLAGEYEIVEGLG